jgi:hypothetical protein
VSVDVFYRGQVVDTPAAREFIEHALERVSHEQLGGIAALLEAKAAAFATVLSRERLAALTEQDAMALLRSIFSTRRRAGVILSALGLDEFRALAGALLYGQDAVEERLAVFHGQVAGIGRGVPENTGFDLASELLHFSRPDLYWLWTRWMWDPATETGSLPLVLTEEVDLTGVGTAETYQRIGFAVSFIDQVGDAAGFREKGHGPFDTDVFLACVYAVYLYTTLRMRMTQEFNQVVPQLDDLLGRLLGVRRSPLLAVG